MADEKSYLSFGGLQTLVTQIKKLVSTAVADASAKAYASADASLKAHAEKKDGNGFIHVDASDRARWDAAATTAAGTVSKTDYDNKVKELEAADKATNDALKLTDGSLADVSSNLNDHVTNTTVHITADERTKWNKVVTDFGTHDSNTDIHVTPADKEVWNKWHDASNNYYKKTETYKKSEVDDKINAAAASVFTFKGTITKAELEGKLASAKVGDVWHISDEQGNEYVCVQDSSAAAKRWEALGHTVDLSLYATVVYVDGKIATVNTSISTINSDISTLKSNVKALQDASAKHALKSDLDTLTTRVTTAETNIKDVSTKLDNFIDSSAGGYATKSFVNGKFTDAKVTFAGNAATATLAADASKLGNKDASEYALKSELAAQMVEAIDDASITALFPENAKA